MVTEGKKIVLYNTSVSSILEYKEKYLKKLCTVLDAFRNRKDVVLLWRPHPLNEATYSSMQPHLLKEYQKIINDYKREGWGIYDDTSDLHRSIAITDAYYGDYSSVAILYQSAGKPVMIQEIEDSKISPGWNYVIFENLIYCNEYYWFSAYHFNGLFRFKEGDATPEFMGTFPGESLKQKRLYFSIVKYNDKLYFTPFSANSIAIYELTTGTFRSINIDMKKIQNNKKFRPTHKFCNAVLRDDSILFFGLTCSGILEYDTIKDTLVYHLDLYEEIMDTSNDFSGFFVCSCVQIEERLILVFFSHNSIVELNLLDLSYEQHYLDTGWGVPHHICFDGNYYWLLSSTGDSVLKLNKEFKTERHFNVYSEDFKDKGFSSMHFVENKLFLLPKDINLVFRINVSNDEIEIADEFLPEYNSKVDDWVCVPGNIVNNKLVFCCPRTRSILFVDGNNVLRFRLKLRELDEKKYHEEDLSSVGEFSNYILCENTGNSFEDFINYDLKSIKPKVSEDFEINAGQRIYNYIKTSVLV